MSLVSSPACKRSTYDRWR